MHLLVIVGFSGKLSRLAVRLQNSVQTPAHGDHLIGIPRKPRTHPHGSLEKGLRRLIRMANGDAHHQTAGVDKAYLVEQAPGRRKAARDGTYCSDTRQRGRDATQAKGPCAGPYRWWQSL